MLARAARRTKTSAVPIELMQMDVTRLAFPDSSFDAAVAGVLFFVLPDNMQLEALRERSRVAKPGGVIRTLEYVRPRGKWRRVVANLWEPWIGWAYGASFDRRTEEWVAKVGLELVESRFVVHDLIKMICARVPHDSRP